MHYLVFLFLVSASSHGFAFDNHVCPYDDIGAGYLDKAFAKDIVDQQRLVEQLRDKVRLTVARESWRLSIQIQDGSQRLISAVPCDGSPQPRIVSYEPDLKPFVLRASSWETHKVALLSEVTGRVVEMPDVSLPVISPDRRYFVVFGVNYAHAHNQLQLWQITNVGPVKVWSIEPADIHFEAVVWKANREVSVVYYPDGEDVSGNSPPFRTPKPTTATGGVTVKFLRRPSGG